MCDLGATIFLFLLPLASCSGDREPGAPSGGQQASATATPVERAAATPAAPSASGGRNLLMGTGEPRAPEPFTLEQRMLHAASQNDRKTIERALELGAELNAEDDIGRNSLFRAVMDARDLELVRWLHAKGVALDEADSGGRTPLSFAAANGDLEIVRYLVENGAAVETPDMLQRTPLFHAALADARGVAAYLLDHGADVNARDQFGDTPLIVACSKGHGEMAELLLERGADPDLKDQEGRTARERAPPGVEACGSKK